jgi:hypothetical protein
MERRRAERTFSNPFRPKWQQNGYYNEIVEEKLLHGIARRKQANINLANIQFIRAPMGILA